jgi:hypothetical protein
MTSDAEDGMSPDAELVDPDLDFEAMAESALKDHARRTESNASSDTPNGQAMSSSKDPQRPRRKKARRACFACQRAHLTCGKFLWFFFVSFFCFFVSLFLSLHFHVSDCANLAL